MCLTFPVKWKHTKELYSKNFWILKLIILINSEFDIDEKLIGSCRNDYL